MHDLVIMNKWLTISLGTVLGLSHIGMIGMISRQSKFPVVNVPVGQYTSYEIKAGKDGYWINYRSHDPKMSRVERDIKKKGGFLGLGNNTTRTTEEYTMDGSKHLGGEEVPKLSAKQIECIEARGGGKQTGRLVGSSAGAAVAPAISGIPIVGWLAAGWVTMFGGDQGAEIGGIMAEDIVKACREEVK